MQVYLTKVNQGINKWKAVRNLRNIAEAGRVPKGALPSSAPQALQLENMKPQAFNSELCTGCFVTPHWGGGGTGCNARRSEWAESVAAFACLSLSKQEP